jgi:D-serine/D-alanine/glycine transporter
LFMSVIVLLFFGFLLYTLWLDPESRETLLILPAWFVILTLVYFLIIRRHPDHAERRARFKAKVDEEWKKAAAFRARQEA